MRIKEVHVLFYVLAFSSFHLNAQQKSPNLTLFFEKVYLHIDRSFYASGDNIWYKAYLVNGQDHTPMNTSNNLYVELIDPGNKIINREVIRLDNGIGNGDFKLDDSIPGGTYRIRAYTNYMRNFGNNFIFERAIQVMNVPGIRKGEQAKSKGTSQETIKPLPLRNKISFYPEGGSLVEGISSEIAFKAEDESGKGINAEGRIVSSTNDTIAYFKTSHLGMGSFSFNPETGKQYRVVMLDRNMSVKFPPVMLTGYVMKVTDTDPVIKLIVSSNNATATEYPSGKLIIIGRHRGKTFYKDTIFLKNNIAAVSIPGNKFPPGITSLTVLDDKLIPYCERLIYIQDKKKMILNITTGKDTFHSKEKVTADISVTDDAQRPVRARLSVAVMDDNVSKRAGENIFSFLMLQSDIIGNIEDPSGYFDENNPLRFQQLDLLLRTQGWRNFLWRVIRDTNIVVKYLPEPGITISGRVKPVFSKKGLQDMNITLQMPFSKGDKWFMTKSGADGKYFLDGLPLFGTQVVKINSSNAQGKRGGEIFMDSVFISSPAVAPFVADKLDSIAFRAFSKDAAERFIPDEKYKVLQNVTINVSADNERLKDVGFAEYNHIITPADYKYGTLDNFIVNKVPRASWDRDTSRVVFMGLEGRKVFPRYVAPKRPGFFGFLDYNSIPMQEVISIRVTHLVTTPGPLTIDRSDVYTVYLELKAGAYNQDPRKIYTEVAGYYEARVFYSPNAIPDNAKADLRTTIHWEPLIVTDENGKASVTFYNADPKTRVRIDVQGVSYTGIPLAAEKYYEIK